jgi:hypothetical protein
MDDANFSQQNAATAGRECPLFSITTDKSPFRFRSTCDIGSDPVNGKNGRERPTAFEGSTK